MGFDYKMSIKRKKSTVDRSLSLYICQHCPTVLLTISTAAEMNRLGLSSNRGADPSNGGTRAIPSAKASKIAFPLV